MSKVNRRQVERLKKPASRPESEIDLSDVSEIREIPPDAVIGKFYKPKEQSITIHLDADVVAWLRLSGEGYQTRVNDYLRQLMNSKRAR